MSTDVIYLKRICGGGVRHSASKLKCSALKNSLNYNPEIQTSNVNKNRGLPQLPKGGLTG